MTTSTQGSLVGLLGSSRAQVVDLLRSGVGSAAELAERMGISEPAVRRHLQGLQAEGLVETTTVRSGGRGRPSTHHVLSPRARRLYPDRSAEFANELLDYVEAEHGRGALLAFLRWRQGRQSERYATALDGVAEPEARTALLAQLLSEDGFLAQVEHVEAPDGATVLELSQGHCAISSVAAAHPEICAFEAALFRELLGVKLSRRQTIAQGATACVCTVTTNPSSTSTGAGDVHQG